MAALTAEDIEVLYETLEKVKNCILNDSNALKSLTDTDHLAIKCHEVATLMDKKCNAIELESDSDSEDTSTVRGTTMAVPMLSATSSISDSGNQEVEDEEETKPILNAGTFQSSSATQQQSLFHFVNSQPQQSTSGPLATATPIQRVPTPPAPQTTLPVLKNRFGSQNPPVIDQQARKCQLEAEKMVKSLSKRTTFTCGISYNGDESEKKFSDGIKKDLREALPALKTHQHIFRYMAWATTERLECSHCRLCKNEYPSS